jgi:hypothetical protein
VHIAIQNAMRRNVKHGMLGRLCGHVRRRGIGIQQ